MDYQKHSLRQYYRTLRNALDNHTQKTHAKKLAQLCITQGIVKEIQAAGFYWPNDGEISPLPLLNHCLSQHIDCYLPCLPPFKQQSLAFRQCHIQTVLQPNRFNVMEPVGTLDIPVIELDILFLPLVAFDWSGNRLGMGGGYYDCTLQNLKNAQGKKPLLIGLAHACQQADQLPTDPWDIPLNAIITEQTLHWVTSQAHQNTSSKS